MDWDGGIKKVMVEIVQLDPHAWFPKKLVGGHGREYGEGTHVSEDCKSWSELRAVEIKLLADARAEQQDDSDMLMVPTTLMSLAILAILKSAPVASILITMSIGVLKLISITEFTAEQLKQIRLRNLSVWKMPNIRFVAIKKQVDGVRNQQC
jgi:hypothetical protein